MDDVVRALLDGLYDQRVAVAITAAVIAGVVGIVAWRRGWAAIAGRHRGRTGLVVAALLAVGAPVTWYVASPVWIRTSLVEAGPNAPPLSASPPAPSAAFASTAPPPLAPAPSLTSSPTATPFVAVMH